MNLSPVRVEASTCTCLAGVRVWGLVGVCWCWWAGVGAGGRVWWAGVVGEWVCWWAGVRPAETCQACGRLGGPRHDGSEECVLKFGPCVMERTVFGQWACIAIGDVCI